MDPMLLHNVNPAPVCLFTSDNALAGALRMNQAVLEFVQGIAMLNLGSTQVGMILLWGLFFYDIFWVFFTPVMVTVAKNIDGPIKLLFPTGRSWEHFNMLGLGDIVIPGATCYNIDVSLSRLCEMQLCFDGCTLACACSGLFVSLMLRFDTKNGSGKVYFYSAMVGYTIGLIVTLVVMQTFKAAQPALLYIVPGVVGCVLIQAAIRGEIKQLLAYTEEEEEEEDKSVDVADEVVGSGKDQEDGASAVVEEVKKDQ